MDCGCVTSWTLTDYLKSIQISKYKLNMLILFADKLNISSWLTVTTQQDYKL